MLTTGGVWLAIAIAIPIFVLRSFFYEPFRAPSGSMLPTLSSGSHFVVQKLGYGNYGTFGISIAKMGPAVEIKRGDLLVFDFPGHPGVRYVKRVVGLPGDSVVMKGRAIVINGKTVETRRIGSSDDFDIYEETIDGVAFRVMNDRVWKSLDAKFNVPARNYFFLGDNRDHSNDSRYWGFVPAENIVGKVVYVFQRGD